MIWSSPERLPARGGIRPDALARRCVWEDLGGGHRALEAAGTVDPHALREQELDAAYSRGRAEGEQAAHARARREMETALAAARAVVREARDAQAGWNRVLEENLAAMATAVATRLIQREVACDPGLLHDLVRQALAAFPPRQEIRVRVHPADLAALGPDGATPEGCHDHDVRWVADEGIVRGGCLLEGPDRIVDGRLDEGLKRIYQVLAHG